ncbi:MAG: YfiR/HmsC family protein [Candidatus Ozemobacteraceae bacterium]
MFLPSCLRRLRLHRTTVVRALLFVAGIIFAGPFLSPLFHGAGFSCSAHSTVIPLDLELSVFLKIICYNRSLPVSSSKPFRLGIVLPSGTALKEVSELKAVAESVLSGKTLLGRAIKVSLHVLGTPIEAGAKDELDLLIMHGDGGSEFHALPEYASKKGIMIFGTDPDHLSDGLTVVLAIVDGQPVIHLNLTAARSVKADFHANFLKHCQVHK